MIIKKTPLALISAMLVISACSEQSKPAQTASAKKTEVALKVGFVYVSPVSDAGWSFQHNKGRLEMEKSLGHLVTSKFVDSVSEGADAERVIREMAKDGHKIIFTTSFGYMNQTEKVAKQFPEVKFIHATGYKSGENFDNYNARFYEGRYVNGIVAGSMTKTDILGYVAAFPIPEVLQGINAFTLGAQSVNPNIRVRVVWVNSWFDPGKEREAANALISQGVDVITHHTESTSVVQTAEEKGIYAFGYHSDMSKYGPNAHLSATIHEWGNYYTNTVKSVIAGNWQVKRLLGGYQENMVKTSPLNDAVPDNVKAMVADIEKQLTAGTFHPFAGPFNDQDGKERVAANAFISDDDLGKMDYYVYGVDSKLSKK